MYRFYLFSFFALFLAASVSKNMETEQHQELLRTLTTRYAQLCKENPTLSDGPLTSLEAAQTGPLPHDKYQEKLRIQFDFFKEKHEKGDLFYGTPYPTFEALQTLIKTIPPDKFHHYLPIILAKLEKTKAQSIETKANL